MNIKNDVIFQEVQYSRKIWLWVLISMVIPVALTWFAFVMQVFLGHTFGRPVSNVELTLLWLAFGVLLPFTFCYLFCYFRLITLVMPCEICLRLIPFQLSYHKVLITDLLKYEVREYDPIREYGGWGIRKGRSGAAYNIKGNIGMQLELKNGKRILIGTQKPEEFKKALELVVSNSKN